MKQARLALPTLLAVLIALVTGGCGDDTAPDNQILDGGITETDDAQSVDAGLVWESSPWSSGWIDFPGRATITVEHSLGRDPVLIVPYLSFDAEGADRTASVASGNEATLSVGCPEGFAATRHCVRVKNRTSADFYLRLVLQ